MFKHIYYSSSPNSSVESSKRSSLARFEWHDTASFDDIEINVVSNHATIAPKQSTAKTGYIILIAALLCTA